MGEIKIDVETMLDRMKEKFKEGLFLATTLENYTRDGDEEAVKEIVDILKIDFNDYVESAKAQDIWGVNKNETLFADGDPIAVSKPIEAIKKEETK